MTTNWQIRIVDKGYAFSRDVFIFRKLPGGAEFIQKDDTCVFIAEGSAIKPKAAIELEPEQLQALADELSKVGYKPQKGFMEGKLKATEKHLEDMRTLVFKPSLDQSLSALEE